MSVELVRIGHGIWRPKQIAEDETARIAALLAGCPPGSVLAGRTAAHLLGLWLPDRTERPLEVIVHHERGLPATRPHGRRPEMRTRRQRLVASEVVIANGLPVTSPARTWFDLCSRLSDADLTALGDSALRAGASIDDLAAAIAAGKHCRGVVKARVVLPMLDGRSRSRPESHLRYVLLAAGLPAPEVNVAIRDEHGQWLGEPDLSYGDIRLAIEYNGVEHADEKRMRRDITRTLDLEQRGGWRVVTFGPAEVFGRPDQVVVRVRELRRELSIGWRGKR